MPRQLIDAFTSNGQNRIAFPVVTTPKGDQYDNFGVYGPDGQRLQVLTYPEYLRFTAGVLRLLIVSAYGLESGKASLPPDAEEVEFRCLLALLRRGPSQATPTPAEIASRIAQDPGEANEVRARIEYFAEAGPENALAHFRALRVKDPRHEFHLVKYALDTISPHDLLANLDAPDKAHVQLAAELVRKLSENYAIVAYLPYGEDGRFMATYENTVVPDLKFAPTEKWHLYGKFKGWLRVFLGARPVNIGIKVHLASTCESYHLRVIAPEGLYLHNQRLVEADAYLSRQADGAPTTPYIRFRARRGQSYAHFYTRFFSEPTWDEPAPVVRFVFLETPPGSLFRATVAGVANLLLIWLVGTLISHGYNPGDEVPAFILVFPALAATWLGFEGPSDRLLNGTLAARLSLITTAVTSLAGSALYMAASGKPAEQGSPDQAGEQPFGDTFPLDISVLGITNSAWGAIALAALLNASTITYLYVIRSWSFHYLSSRPQSHNHAQEITEEEIDAN